MLFTSRYVAGATVSASVTPTTPKPRIPAAQTSDATVHVRQLSKTLTAVNCARRSASVPAANWLTMKKMIGFLISAEMAKKPAITKACVEATIIASRISAGQQRGDDRIEDAEEREAGNRVDDAGADEPDRQSQDREGAGVEQRHDAAGREIRDKEFIEREREHAVDDDADGDGAEGGLRVERLSARVDAFLGSGNQDFAHAGKPKEPFPISVRWHSGSSGPAILAPGVALLFDFCPVGLNPS